MKLLLQPAAFTARRVLILLLLFASCKKSSDHPFVTPVAEDKAQKYIGTYHVTEDAFVYYPVAGDTTHTEFTGQIIRDHSFPGSILPDDRQFTDTLNVIALIQSGRDPAPQWAAPGREINYGSDTITFKVYKHPVDAARDTIMSAYGILVELQILGKDSLSLRYIFGSSAAAYSIYQKWVKQ